MTRILNSVWTRLKAFPWAVRYMWIKINSSTIIPSRKSSNCNDIYCGCEQEFSDYV